MSITTVGDLRDQLRDLDANMELLFPGGLTLYRLKLWGNDGVILEFNELQADLPDEFKKDNPHVKVAFIDHNYNE